MERSILSGRQRVLLWMRLGIRVFILVLVLDFASKFGRRILDLTLPFLLGWGIAILLDPVVEWAQRRLGGSRKMISLLLIIGLLSLVGGGAFLLFYCTGRELVDLITNWDILFEGVQTAMDSIDVMFVKFFSLIPPELTVMADSAVTGLLGWIQEAIPAAVKELGGHATDKFKGLPSFVISCIFFLLGSYFILADYRHLCARASKGISGRLLRGMHQIRSTALLAFGGYLKAQLLLSFGVFCILLLGFLVSGQQYSLLLAVALAVLDFIPLLGAGTVMVPWAFFSLLVRNYDRAISVAVIWGIIAIYRRIAEPKIVGDQTGLSPILSLFSIYVGMKLGGIPGMILGPVVVLVALNLCRGGMLRPAWSDIQMAALDIKTILAQRPEN